MRCGSTRNFRFVDHVFAFSRKSGVYRYWYRIHGRCPRYKGSLLPSHEELQCPPLLPLRLPILPAFLRPMAPVTLKGAKARTKKSRNGPATRISGAVSVQAFITESEGNCWKESRSKGRKGGKKKELVRHRETCWSGEKKKEGEKERERERKRKKERERCRCFRQRRIYCFSLPCMCVIVQIYTLVFTG